MEFFNKKKNNHYIWYFVISQCCKRFSYKILKINEKQRKVFHLQLLRLLLLIYICKGKTKYKMYVSKSL